jgi:hypothetical protein
MRLLCSLRVLLSYKSCYTMMMMMVVVVVVVVVRVVKVAAYVAR